MPSDTASRADRLMPLLSALPSPLALALALALALDHRPSTPDLEPGDVRVSRGGADGIRRPHSDAGGQWCGGAAAEQFVNRPECHRAGPGSRRGPVGHSSRARGDRAGLGGHLGKLGQVPGLQVDFLLVTYQPGGTSSTSGELMRHNGFEYGYLVTGELTLHLGFDEHQLAAGDAVSFASSTPHGYRNDGGVPAAGVWLVLDQD